MDNKDRQKKNQKKTAPKTPSSEVDPHAASASFTGSSSSTSTPSTTSALHTPTQAVPSLLPHSDIPAEVSYDAFIMLFMLTALTFPFISVLFSKRIKAKEKRGSWKISKWMMAEYVSF